METAQFHVKTNVPYRAFHMTALAALWRMKAPACRHKAMVRLPLAEAICHKAGRSGLGFKGGIDRDS